MISRDWLGFTKGSRRNMRSGAEECSEVTGVGCAQVVLHQDGDWEFRSLDRTAVGKRRVQGG